MGFSSAQNHFEFSTGHYLLLGLLLLVALLSLFAWEWKKAARLQLRKSSVGWSRFRAAASAWRLSPEQLQLLELIVRSSSIRDVDAVFSNASVFETMVDRWVSKNPSAKRVSQIRELRELLGYGQLSPSVQLVSTRQLNAGDRVKLLTQTGEEPVSTVIDQLDDLSWAVRNVQGIHLSPSDMVVVHYSRVGDGEYRIAASVSSCSTHQIKLFHSMEFEYFRMRNWVRIELSLPALMVLPSQKEQAISVWLTDISGGGASFKTTEKLEIGTVVELSFKAQNHDFSAIKSQIVRTQQDRFLSTCSVEFVELDTQEREKLVRYIFDLQRISRAVP